MQNRLILSLRFLLVFLCSFTHLNAQLLESNYISPPSLDRVIDITLPVFSIPGVLNTSNGAASYSIPINVPKGVNGLQPNISVVYNSTSGNGLLGWAWDLSVGSIISRTGSNYVFDGKKSGVDFSNNDNLSLDGQRLILFNGNHLTVGSEYRTSVQSFQQIEFLDGETFRIEQKDGIKKYYGQTALSRLSVTVNSSQTISSWLLDMVEDRHGNKVYYDYVIDAAKNNYRLDKITYVDVAGNQKAQVSFVYMERNDVSQGYVSGVSFISDAILKRIETSYDGVEFSKYEFSYSWSTGQDGEDFSRLAKVDYWGFGQEVNSTLIQWNSSVHEVYDGTLNLNRSTSVDRGAHGSYVFMDVDGDGHEDILSLEYDREDLGDCWHNLSKRTMEKHSFSIYALKSFNSSAQRVLIKPKFISQFKPDDCWRRAFARIHTGDFNGDGLADFLLQRVEDGEPNRYYVEVYLNDLSNPGNFILKYSQQIYDQLPYMYDPAAANLPYEPGDNDEAAARFPLGVDFDGWARPGDVPFELLVADFDGDGVSDFGYTASNASTGTLGSYPTISYPIYWKINYFDPMPSNSSTNLNLSSYYMPRNSTSTWDRTAIASIGDFNGDGKADIIMFDEAHTAEITVCKSRTNWDHFVTLNNCGADNFQGVGDFNGDGISDIFQNIDPLNHFDDLIFLSKGDGSFVLETDLPGIWIEKSHLSYWFVADVDNDNRDDIVLIYGNFPNSPPYDPDNAHSYRYTGFEEMEVYLNKTTGWISHTWSPPGTMYQNGVEYGRSFYVGKFFGEGDDFQLLYDPQGTSNWAGPMLTVYFSGLTENRYVSKVLDGYNRLTELTFTPIFNTINFSINHSDYPNIAVSGSLRVITEIQQRDFKTNLFNSLSYEYESPKLNLEGLGFLGYSSITEFDHIQGIKTKKDFDFLQSNVAGSSNLFGLKHVDTKLISGGDISDEDINYHSSLINTFSNNNWQFAAPQRYYHETFDYVTNSAFKDINSAYDNFGNVTTHYKRYFNNSAAIQSRLVVQTTTTYSNDGSWINWLPEDIVFTTTRLNETPVVIEKNFEYDNSGNLERKFVFKNTAGEVESEYSYDLFGNVVTKTISPAGLSSRTTSYTWTPDGRFIETETNPLNWTKSYSYNPTNGKVMYVIDENQKQTDFEYDELARLKKTIKPNGNEEEFEKIWDVGSTLLESLFYEKTSGTSQPPRETWYNGKMLKIREKVKNREDDWVWTKSIYNPRGLLWRAYLPYSSSANEYTEYSYDSFGRVTSGVSSTNTITTSYSGRSITTLNTGSNQTITKSTHSDGTISQLTDYGGTVTYSYNSWGKVRQITTPSSVTSILFDAYGRQDKLIDMSSGTTDYDYDALGQLVSQIDGEGNTYTMDYDQLGRLTTKYGPDGNYGYNYDSQWKGAPDQVTSPYGTSVTYSYDNLGRITTLNEQVSGQNFDFQYTYNTDGNIETIEYPNNLIIEHGYSTYGTNNNNYGYLTEIKRQSDQQSIWEYVESNEFLQITGYKLGATTVNRTYDALSGLPIEHTNNVGFDFQYSFDNETGNLDERTTQYSVDESFTYDPLDRLTDIDDLAGNTLSIAYAASGNISTKSDVGTYDYGDGHAVEQITDDEGNISDELQLISYTPFNSVKTIMEDSFEAVFTYGPDNQRRRMQITQEADPHIDRYYIGAGLYEKDLYEGKWRELVYIPTPTGVEAVYISDEGKSNFELHLLTRDYLGSILQVSDQNGLVLEEYSFDAWGNRRSPQSLQNSYTPGQNNNLFSGLIYRGYSGHEHLDCFGLVNMNGRLYDPLLGRMLSSDNFVQNTGSTQSYNRYSYVFNNPLKYSDPTGEAAWFAPLIYGAVNVGVDLAINKGRMGSEQITTSAITGASGGALSGASNLRAALAGAGATQFNKLSPGVTLYESESFNLSVSPMIGVGSSGYNLGASINTSGQSGSFVWSASAFAGFNSGMSSLGELAGGSYYFGVGGFAGYTDGNTNYGLGLSTTWFSGNTKQRVGAITAQIGDLSLRMDEDFFPIISDRGDQYRTGGFLTTYKINDDLTLAFGGSMITGSPGVTMTHPDGNPNVPGGILYDGCSERCTNLRGGTMFGGAIYNRQSYFIGHNSEKRLHDIQNLIHRNVNGGITPYFEDRLFQSGRYSYYGGYDPYYLYY